MCWTYALVGFLYIATKEIISENRQGVKYEGKQIELVCHAIPLRNTFPHYYHYHHRQYHSFEIYRLLSQWSPHRHTLLTIQRFHPGKLFIAFCVLFGSFRTLKLVVCVLFSFRLLVKTIINISIEFSNLENMQPVEQSIR